MSDAPGPAPDRAARALERIEVHLPGFSAYLAEQPDQFAVALENLASTGDALARNDADYDEMVKELHARNVDAKSATIQAVGLRAELDRQRGLIAAVLFACDAATMEETGDADEDAVVTVGEIRALLGGLTSPSTSEGSNYAAGDATC